MSPAFEKIGLKNRIHFVFVLIFVALTSVAQGATDWDLNFAVERMANQLLGDSPIDREDVENIFTKILVNQSEQLTEHKRDKNQNSKESYIIISTHSSTEIVGGMENFIDDFFEDPFRTPEQLQVRKDFINMLHYLEDKVPQFAFQKGVKMIAEKLSA